MIKVDYEQGATLQGLTTYALFALQIAGEAFEHFAGEPAILTAGADGEHSDYSGHYRGDAIDLRVWHVSDEALELIIEYLKEALIPYTILNEETHLHIRYKPKKPLNYDKWVNGNS